MKRCVKKEYAELKVLTWTGKNLMELINNLSKHAFIYEVDRHRPGARRLRKLRCQFDEQSPWIIVEVGDYFVQDPRGGRWKHYPKAEFNRLYVFK